MECEGSRNTLNGSGGLSTIFLLVEKVLCALVGGLVLLAESGLVFVLSALVTGVALIFLDMWTLSMLLRWSNMVNVFSSNFTCFFLSDESEGELFLCLLFGLLLEIEVPGKNGKDSFTERLICTLFVIICTLISAIMCNI